MSKKLIHSEIKFDYQFKQHSFHVVHNLEEFGLDIEAAFINWSVRFMGKPTIMKFCTYVINKDPYNLICRPYERNTKNNGKNKTV